ncbi:hypothetical protein LEMLEM_LOCUS6755 [Lemmus lemmus]
MNMKLCLAMDEGRDRDLHQSTGLSSQGPVEELKEGEDEQEVRTARAPINIYPAPVLWKALYKPCGETELKIRLFKMPPIKISI